MWKWNCPLHPNWIYEHHTETQALEGLDIHMHDSELQAMVPCRELHHELPVDDGVPCGVENCRHEYVPSSERR